jgi:hypothetical protein
MRLDESYRLVTKVLVPNSHCDKIQKIFLITIAVAVQLFLVAARQRCVCFFILTSRSVLNRDGHFCYELPHWTEFDQLSPTISEILIMPLGVTNKNKNNRILILTLVAAPRGGLRPP